MQILLKAYPDFFKTIPWSKTGLPISLYFMPSFIFFGKVYCKFLTLLDKLKLYAFKRNYHDYRKWVRSVENWAVLKETLLTDTPHYEAFISKETVLRDLENIQDGNFSNFERTCNIFTFETWAQRLYSL